MRWSFDEVTRKITKKTIGKVDIYFLSRESIAVVRNSNSPYGDLSQYVLYQSWYERNKKPFQRFKRQIRSATDLSFMDIQLLACRYKVQVTSVSEQIVPSYYREAAFLEPQEIAPVNL